MQVKLDNYKKIKGLLFFAKQTFLNEKGQEITPTIENLMEFKEKINSIMSLLNEIEEGLHK
ncbi:hypothetical protein LCGC14_1894290 [marine sediment metagenome]|uniref:Uncharacterized protein n=1 Tax=marine sediment metagenome TaxID=412755 RepID=A0A0F9FYH2_9ZZZZ